jgi:UDP-perosamine 4-acetyltransferase
MGSHVIITASTTIGGVCTIEDKVFIGLNATIANKIHIKQKALIGAGTVVIRNIEENTKNVGNPSRSIGIRFKD